MTLVIPPGYGNAAFIFTSQTGTAPFVTTLGFDISAATGDFVDIANFLKAAYAAALGPATSNALVLDRVSLAIGQDGPGGSVDSSTSPQVMGSSGAAGPMAMAVIARKVTNQFGRYGRGRMFLPGINAEAGIETDGSLTTSYRTQIATALDTFHTTVSTAGAAGTLTPVLLHSPGPYGSPTPITNLAVSDLVGWVRGRIR